MKLKELKKMIDWAVKHAGKQDVDVFFYLHKDKNETEYEVKEMGQFNFIKDVNITLQKAE